MKTLSQFLLILFTTAYLTGCESVPKDSNLSVQWQSHRVLLNELQNYQLAGKLGYISPDKRQNLNFTWKYSPEKSQLRLSTFLGQTVLNLTITPDGSQAVTSEGETYSHSDPATLVYRLTGLTLPIDYMQDWIKGLPTAADHFALNGTNTLATLRKLVGTQSWDMSYLSYQTVNSVRFGALPLPSRMDLSQGESKLKIVISKWTLNR